MTTATQAARRGNGRGPGDDWEGPEADPNDPGWQRMTTGGSIPRSGSGAPKPVSRKVVLRQEALTVDRRPAKEQKRRLKGCGELPYWIVGYKVNRFLSAPTFHVLFLILYSHNASRGAFPSIKWLCTESMLKRATVVYALKELREAGIIRPVGTMGHGVVRYRIYHDPPAHLEARLAKLAAYHAARLEKGRQARQRRKEKAEKTTWEATRQPGRRPTYPGPNVRGRA